jgi:hypothetical protein
MRLERLIERLDEEWRSPAEMEAHLTRLLNAPVWDTLAAPTARVALDGFGVLERDAAGRVRKRPGYAIPSRADWEEAENVKLREIQELERKHFDALDKRREEERGPAWEAERAVIVRVVDERLRELGLLNDAPAARAGESE